jgi:hypothetical protein
MLLVLLLKPSLILSTPQVLFSGTGLSSEGAGSARPRPLCVEAHGLVISDPGQRGAFFVKGVGKEEGTPFFTRADAPPLNICRKKETVLYCAINDDVE